MNKERKGKIKVVKIGFGRIRVNGVLKKWEKIEKGKEEENQKEKEEVITGIEERTV